MKKVFSVITAVFLFVMCGVLSACSGRYDEFEYNITYAYSENATDWYDGNNGIFANYGGEDDLLQIDEESGVGSIFVKVEVRNVRAKYIDDIIVTKTGESNGLNFSSATVDQNQVFRIDITGNVQTGLRFYETNSGRQISIDLSVYRSLTSISANTSIKPAVAVGGMLNLLTLSNLTYLPLGQTNQTGVNYQVMSIGYYADVNQERTYIESQNQTSAQSFITISDGGVLQLSQDFTVRAQEYVARIRATSRFNENIYADFDVYLVESQDYTPVVHYSNDINAEDITDVVTLYRDSAYASTEFTIDLTDLDTIYKNDIMTNDGLVSYKVVVYVDGVEYDLSQINEGYNGLIVQMIDDLHYRIIATNNTISTNELTFALQIEDLIFNSTAPEYEKTLNIIKSVLPTNISINDVVPEDGTAQGTIYSTSSSTYAGLELRLLTIPTDVNTNDYIYIEANNYITVSGVSVESLGGNRYRIRSGETIYLSLRQNAPASQLIYIRAQATPDRFENVDVPTEWVEIAYTISKVVTANSLSVYADSTITNNIDNGELYINARANTSFYVRVDYSGGTLDASSITISSNNSNIKFLNNSSTINLADSTVKNIYTSSTGNYNIYEVGILATSSVETALITVLAGDNTVGVGTEFMASSVYLVNNDRLTIQSSSTNANAIDLDNGHINYAIVKNRSVDFEVLGYVSNSSSPTANAITDITVSTNLDYSTGSFNRNAVEFNKISNNEFSVMGIIGSSTQVLNVAVHYYAMVDNLITLVEQILIVELAVYDPISNISINATPNQIVYINQYFEETSVSNINFSSYASNNASASTNVVFSMGSDEVVVNHASQLRVLISNDLTIDESVEVVLVNGQEEIPLSNNTIISSSLGEDILSGNIQVRLSSSNYLYNEITISLVALRFGETSNISTSTTIRFVDYDLASGITIWGDEIVSNGIDSQYIYMSFIDVEDGGSDTATFNAQAYYDTNESNNMRFDDLDYILYSVEQEDDGSIALDENGDIILNPISNDRLNITIDDTNHTVTIVANKSLGGGLFMLTLVTKDSYSDLNGTYATSYSMFVSISDGTLQNRYTIQSVDDLKNIINDMNANYVLSNNLTIDNSTEFSPIGLNGETIESFTGSLSGTTQYLSSGGTDVSTSRYQITLNLSTYVEDGENYYSALFARIGEGGYIRDLDINVSFDTANISALASDGSLNIGAIAGVNDGVITGVNVYINSTNTSNVVFASSNIQNVEINFGAVVGINNGNIDLTTSNVIFSSRLRINSSSSSNHNIGAVAGTNNGAIFGAYSGKADLNSISYTIIADITITNTSTASVGSNYYVGGVAGLNTGTINDIILGGRLYITNGSDVNVANALGYIAGVAGQSVSSQGNVVYSNTIDNIALLGLDISAINTGLDVAGVVGNSSYTNISEVRFMSANVTFSNALSANGSLSGDNIVAGIVAYSQRDSINRGIVENFINLANGEIFYTFNSRTNRVAGLVYSVNGTTIDISFVNANINAHENLTNEIYLTSPSNVENNTYYIGQINNYSSLLNYINACPTNGNHYSIIHDDQTVYFAQANVWNELSITDFITTTAVDMSEAFTKSIADYMIEQEVSEEEFLDYLATGLYINNAGIYTKLDEDSQFDEAETYYVFDYEIWDLDRVSLYEADIDGNLVHTSDTEYDLAKTYYTLTEDYSDILNTYLLVDNHFVLNTSTTVNINNNYLKLSFENTANWEAFVRSLLTDSTNWQTRFDLNYITLYGFNFYFPYLVYGADNEPIMVIRPTDIVADIDEDYVISIDSIYIEDEPNIDGYNVTSTTIINYYNDIYNPLNNIRYNTYNLINTAGEGEEKNGLINLEVLPAEAQGGVNYEIVRGAAYAYISNGQIIFTGVSGNNPIVVRCYSVFNSALEEYVIFYTQLGLNELVLTSNSIYEINEENAVYELYTYTGANSVLVNVEATNIKDNLEFATIFDADIDQYIELEVVRENTSSVLTVEDANSLNGVMIGVANNDFEGDRVSEILTFRLLLNLTQYFGDTVYPQIEGQDQMLELKTTSLRVIVYKSATNLEIDGGDYSIQTNSNIDFDANLYTGYVRDDDIGGQVDYTSSNNTISLIEENKDSISLTMNVVDGQEELNRLLVDSGEESIVDLFDYVFMYTPIRSADRIIGYTYNIALSLKNEFEYRYIESNIILEIVVYSTNNPNVSDAINLTLMPTELSTVRIENYTATSVTPGTSYTNLISSNNTETSIISPGGYGGVMLIYLEPSYSNIVSATLTSSTLFVPSLNREVSLIYEQLVYNASTGTYQTVYPSNEQIDGGIVLRKVSYIDENNNYHYDGTIYIHTQMDMFSGLSSTVRATLTVETSNNNVRTVTKTLLTQYLPGASLSYDGYYMGVSDDGDSQYLIQEDTYNNEISIQIYGYQFSQNPDISFEWVLDENSSKYAYGATNGIIINIDENDSAFGREYRIGDYLSFRLLNNYNDVVENFDGSYTMPVMLNVSADIPATFKMNVTLTLATDDSLVTSEEEGSLIFYPVPYLVSTDSAYLNGLANGVLNTAVDRTVGLDFNFTTENPNYDLSAEIYEKLVADIGVENLANLFYYTNDDGEVVYFSDGDAHPEFEVNVIDNMLTIRGTEGFSRTINFEIHYGYVLNGDKYELRFGLMSSNSLSYTMNFSFTLNINVSTTEEHAIPIYSVDQIFDPNTGECILGEGLDYILMNDITIDNLVPISVNIASFDGNNRVIKIRSFAISTDRTEYGLFANISTYQDANGQTQSTILKNIIVDYSEFNTANNGRLLLTQNDITDITFGGLVANNNGALIYNCDVMNLSASTKTVNIVVDNSDDVNVTFGGLVGNNSGIITNSRVGKDGYTRITADQYSESTNYVTGGALQFIVGDTTASEGGQGFVATTGGFVGVNTGTIASSFVSNTSLVNYSTAPEGLSTRYSMTAGFVGENSGTISYSYVKGADTDSSTNPYSTGAQIKSTTNGNVAGFVYLNSGEINNSYANTVLVSNSAYVAGFVYNNAASGSITESYAACTLNGVATENDVSEQPFVGVSNNNELLSYGTLENTYYLVNDDDDYIVRTEEGKDQAVGYNTDNFADSNALTGFVFINSNSRTEREQGVWSYYNADNDYRLLPQLNTANSIAYSYRYLIGQEDEEYVYSNAVSYALGSANNPYIIRSVAEYNDIFLSGGTQNSMSGYVRFINNIDFASDETAIQTRVNYTLGDANNISVTSIEGNGMTISGIFLDVANATESSIGLFSNIKNAYVKNLNLEFASTPGFSSVRVAYSGGLAGTINNSVIINVDLDGGSTTITGNNFAGGLAGIITGNSLIYGIDSNLSVKAVNTDVNNYYMYYSEDDFDTMRAIGALSFNGTYDDYLEQLSYAGGIAGVIDIQERTNVDFNLSYITINGNEMYAKSNEGNILADYAGGIAGYAGRETRALKLKYNVGTTNLITGQFAVGGLYAVGLGDLTASQVTAEEDEQYEYDTALGGYILDLEDAQTTETASVDTENSGNLNLLESYRYGGGLVGIGIQMDIQSCYSKASFMVGSTVGGLIGCSIISNVSYSYAVPYVNIDDTYLEYAGGLFGAAYGVRNSNVSRNEEVSEYVAYVNQILRITNDDNDIQFTFSTLLLDNSMLHTQHETSDGEFVDINYDYISANYGQLEGNNTGYITSNGNAAFTYVYAGIVNNYASNDSEAIVKHANDSRASEVDLSQLYDLEDIEHTVAFNNVFSGWSTEYWSLNPDRYFPLLLNDNTENYYIIDDVDDFYVLINNPDGNYKIVEDIDLTSWCENNYSNFVFNIDFTGILIGEKENNEIPVLSGLSVNTVDTGNAGLFRSTNDATIRNITFNWSNRFSNVNTGSTYSIQLNSNVGMVGAVSADDTQSLFSNLAVNVEADSLVGTTATSAISGFGGIVANAQGSNIMNCSFVGNVSSYLDGTGSVYFGGLVGRASIYAISESEDENMSIMNSTIGKNGVSVNFDLTISSNSTGGVYIGGAVGYAEETTISSIRVGHYSYSSNRRVNISVDLNNCTTNNFIGGLLGRGADTQVSSCDALTNINVKGAEGASDGTVTRMNIIGGLIGQYALSGESSININTSNTESYITIGDSEDNMSTVINNLFVSTGVGYVYSNIATVEIKQCVFIGEIDTVSYTMTEGTVSTEVEFDNALINVYSGGAVAYASNGINDASELTIDEVMVTTNIFVGSRNMGTTDGTDVLYAGGLVGQGYNVDIINSATTGRIVPITDVYTDFTNINIGGMIGQANSVDVLAAYSLTSIITDGVADDVIQGIGEDKFNVGALFGDLTLDTNEATDLYYSTDYALFPEESGLGTNLAAYTLAYTNLWRESSESYFNEENNYWTEIDTNGSLPFIASLELQLVNYGVISNSTGSYTYYVGGSMRPIVIEAIDGVYTFEDEYTYYILSSNASLTGTTDNRIAFNGTLNGILMAGDVTYTVAATNVEVDGGDRASGLIAVVAEHSAISNLHVSVNATTNYSFSSGVGSNGFITGQNNGVIFNSSVTGQGITLSGNSRGILVGRNNGLISYSYSNIEVVRTAVPYLGGITYINQGKILSCYFTGYINNTDDTSGTTTRTGMSAGIIGNILTRDYGSAGSYVYNCYMAGVIEDISASNSFANGTFTSVDSGSNNFIDSLANNESGNISYTDKDGSVTVVTCVSTADLMSANVLEGEWHTSTVPYELNLETGTVTQYYFDLQSSVYGYNYLYPFYEINKIDANDLTTNIDNRHQLYTGRGYTDINTVYTDKTQANYEEILLDISNNDFFKIPHLGVLSAVQGISTIYTSTEGGVDTIRYTYLNYMLIYDLDNNLSNAWTAVGVAGGLNSGFYSSTAHEFNGLFITNKYYDFTALSMDNACTISGLHTNGLFTNINSAYFAYLKIGDMYNLKNSGALGVNVGTSNNLETQTITIANVLINGEIRSNTNDSTETYLGGLFGTISAGTINIYNLDTTRTDVTGDTLAGITLEGNTTGTVAGLIAGRMAGGTITFIEPNNTVVNKIYVQFSHVNYGGGLVGDMSAGTITGVNLADGNMNSTVYVFTSQVANQTEVNDNIGGIIGRSTSSNGVKTITNVNVIIPDAIYTNTFGGLIAEVYHDITFSNCVIDSSNSMEIMTSIGGENSYFGLLAAKLGDSSAAADNTPKLTVDGFAFRHIDEMNDEVANRITITAVSNIGALSNYNYQGFGLLIGRQNADFELTFDYNYNFQPRFIVSNAHNVGGLIGRYDAGYVRINRDADMTNLYLVEVSGANNVGGAIGYVSGSIANIFEFDSTMVEGSGDYWNFLTEGNGENSAFATVYNATGYNLTQDSLENWGGLFGYYSADKLELYLQDDETETTALEKQTITNYNNVYITYKTASTQSTQTIYNVGGVAGKVDAIVNGDDADGYLSDLTNSGRIAYTHAENLEIDETYADMYLGLDSENEMFAIEANTDISTILTVNVGGVIGLLTNVNSATTEVRDLTNTGEIEGYQNVGGIIGYANLISIENNIYEETTSLQTGQVYFSYDEDAATYEAFIATGEEAAGRYYSLNNDLSIRGRVAGVLNVGGAFGYVTGTVDSVWSYADVYGNANVGGLIGALNDVSTTIKNSVVMPNTTSTGGEDNELTIKGIYFVKRQDITVSGRLDRYNTYFMPNSVGGLVGIAIAGRVQNNVVYDAFITSSAEGTTAPGAGEYDGSSVISTNENNMVNISVATGSSTAEYFTSDQVYDYTEQGDGTANITTKYNDISTGFGGFIGTVSDDVAMNTNPSNVSEMYIESNSVKADIQAGLGVNVGTFYGYYYTDSIGTGGVGTSRYIVTPTLLGDDDANTIDVNVSGAYNIGGVVGMFEAGANIELSRFDTNDIQGAGNINVQTEGVGMYVGGLVGKLIGNADTLIATNDDIVISITTNSSYYIGGLIGRLEGNLDGESDASGILIPSGQDSVSEFGGLVGMLKVETADGGTTATVRGVHNYAFTVNTIENSNYYDGPTSYSYDDNDTSNIYLIAQALYVNQDTFQISPTSNTAYYSATANNPTNNNSTGWAIDYTMFKVIQRCDPNSGTTWDAISIVYNAENITYVATVANQGLTDTPLAGPKSLDGNDAVVERTVNTSNSNYNTYIYKDAYILYTIYEEVEGQAKLYSPIGIATPYYNGDGDYATPENNNFSFWDGLQLIASVVVGTDPPATHYELDLGSNNVSSALTYLDFNGSYYTAEDRVSHKFVPTDSESRGYVFEVQGYYRLNEQGDYVHANTWFSFQYFYENATLDDIKAETKFTSSNGVEINAGDSIYEALFDGATSTDRLAASGSMFEVNGVKTSALDKVMDEGAGATYPWLKGAQTALEIIRIAAAAFTGGSALIGVGAKVFGKLLAKEGVRTALKTFAKAAGKFALRNIPTILVSVLTTIITNQFFATQQAQVTYFSTTNQTIGYMAESYAREIYYEDDILVPQSDQPKQIDEVQYMYYSSVRPADYYQNRYYVYYLESNDRYPDTSDSNIMSTIVADGAITINTGDEDQIAEDFEGAYPCTVTINGMTYDYAYAYDYYRYQNGSYYVIMDAMELDYVVTQRFFDPEGYQRYGDYTIINGSYYTRGSFAGFDSTGKSYSYYYDSAEENLGNLLEYENGEYSVNGVPWGSSAIGLSTNVAMVEPDVEYYLLAEGWSTNEVGNELTISAVDQGEETSYTYYYGYGYMKNAYYTATGDRSISGAETKSGIFSNPSTTRPAGIAGIDYIVANYSYRDEETDITTTTTYYYTLTSVVNTEGTDYTGAIRLDAPASSGDTFTINLYPESFENPYNENTRVANLQDSKYYTINNAGATEEGSLTFSPTYYYYEGGYYTEEIEGNTTYRQVFSKVPDTVTITINNTKVTIDLDTYYSTDSPQYDAFASYLNGLKGENSNIGLNISDIFENGYFKTITIYDRNGNETLVSYHALLHNLNSYSNYYIEDISGLDLSAENANAYSVSANYRIVDNKLYLTNSGLVVMDGILHEVVVEMPVSSTGEVNYNLNRYLVNDEAQIYTRYKYRNTGNFSNGTIWGGNSGYYFFVHGYTTPNSGTTTFVESCRVILGGGGTFYNAGLEGDGESIGSINMLINESEGE